MIKGFLVSICERGPSRVHCQFDLASGQVYPEPSGMNDFGAIRSQYFEDYEANSFSVCPECRGFVTRRTVVCGQEAIACSDPKCPSWDEPGLCETLKASEPAASQVFTPRHYLRIALETDFSSESTLAAQDRLSTAGVA